MEYSSAVEAYLNKCLDHRKEAVLKFHSKHLEYFDVAKGSGHNHQYWDGGYRGHIAQCFEIAYRMYDTLGTMFIKGPVAMPFGFPSVIIVLYFHDIEKMFKYGGGMPKGFDKQWFLYETLKKEGGIEFTDEEKNALEYIHGELLDYKKDQRVMNELAGFCHAVDILSARVFWNRGEGR